MQTVACLLHQTHVAGSGGATAVAVTTTDATCAANNGTLTIGAVTGGVAPYTYSVDGSAFTATTNYTGLAAGNILLQ